MAGDSTLDEFVLKYTVDEKGAEEQLKKLEDKIESVNKKADKSEKGFSELGKTIKDSLSKVSPEVEGTIAVIGKLSGSLTVVTGLITAIVIGFKSMNDLMKEYNIQRDLSFKSGMGVNEIENFQRQINTSSKGRIGSEQSRSMIEKVQNMSFSAYTNPNPMSRESLLLREGGSSPFDKNGALKSTQNILDDLSKKFKQVSDLQAQALGQTIGFTHDEVEALRNRNTTLKQSSNLTAEETRRRQDAIASMDKINELTGDISERFRQMGSNLGAEFLPLLKDFLTLVDQIATALPKMLDPLLEKIDFFRRMNKKVESGANPYGNYDDWRRAYQETSKEDSEKAKEVANKQAQNNQDARASTALFTRSINLFSSAVSTFAGVIDERQAMAAWAGGIGQTAGIGGQVINGTAPAAMTGKRATTSAYDDIITREAKAAGVDPRLVKNIIGVESSFNPKAVSDQGAYGLMQVQKDNFKSVGITNPMDPEQNIRGGVKLLKEYMNKSGGDTEQALRMYHGGYKTEGWGPKTMAYPGKVLGYGASVGNGIDPNAPNYGNQGYINAPRSISAGNRYGTGSGTQIKGQTTDDTQLSEAQQSIASALGVPVGQLMLGGRVNKGDINFAREKLEYTSLKEIQKNEMMMSMPNPNGLYNRQIAEAAKNARSESFHLSALKNYGSQIEGNGRPGGREITVNERGVWIQIDGSQDPLVTAKAVKGALTNSVLSPDIDQMANSVATGVKY